MMQSQVRPHLPVVKGLPPCSDPECPPCAVAIHGLVRHIRAFLEAAGWVLRAPLARDAESEWVAVHPVHPEVWPAGARACAEVWYFLPAELRAEGPAGGSLEAEYRMERIGVLAREMELAGYRVGFVDRGWLGPNLLAVA